MTMTTLKKASWPVSRPDRLLGLSVTAQCRPRAACAGGCKHNAAREWPAPVAGNQPPTMLWQWRWTGNPVGIAIPVTTMVKQEMLERKYDDDNDDDGDFLEFSPLRYAFSFSLVL
jgi:hypothetical protein